jgi:hypothetical protein
MSSRTPYEPSRQTFVPSREEQERLLEGTTTPNPHRTRQQVEWEVEEFFRGIVKLFRRKNEDYARGEDGLSNFRQMAQRLNLPMVKVFLVLMEKHMIAIENDVALQDVVLHEGMEDRLRDLACYCGILHVALKEKADARTP